MVWNSVFEVIYSFFQCNIFRFYKILWNSSKTRVKKCELSESASFHESSSKRVRSSVEVSKNSKINQFWVKCEVETRVNSSFNLTYRIPVWTLLGLKWPETPYMTQIDRVRFTVCKTVKTQILPFLSRPEVAKRSQNVKKTKKIKKIQKIQKIKKIKKILIL